jgi:hypothetical protein
MYEHPQGHEGMCDRPPVDVAAAEHAHVQVGTRRAYRVGSPTFRHIVELRKGEYSASPR